MCLPCATFAPGGIGLSAEAVRCCGLVLVALSRLPEHRRMRFPSSFALAATLCLFHGAAAAGPEMPQTDTPALSALEAQWHGCVREAYADQPATQSKAASQRSALDACKEHEDAYVTAVLAAQVAEEEAGWRREQRLVASRAGAWMARVTAYVFEPVTSWLGAWTR